MNTLYFCLVQRRNFGDLLSLEGMSRLEVKSARDVDSLPQRSLLDHMVLAVWSQNPLAETQLPELLICEDGTESDWAAWITTFGAQIRPFSAFTRLITQSGFQNVVKGARAPALESLTWPVAGLVLGEVLAASNLSDKSLETMSATACASTLSFAMFRAAAVYSSFQDWDHLVEAWEIVRETTRQQPRLIEGAAVARVCGTIMHAAGLHQSRALIGLSDMSLLRPCQEVMITPDVAPSSLSMTPQFAETERRMHGPREDRVVAFTEFVRSIDRTSTADPALTSFVLGYFASRIAPGTIQHSSVLGPITHRYATALLWYGFFAGFGDHDLNLKSASGRRTNMDLPGSARRVARDLLRPEPVVGPPSCDIGVLELLALSRTGGDPLSGLITTTQGTATIELAPAVWTVVNVSSKFAAEATRHTAREREILATMGESIDRLRESYSDLVGSEPPSREGGQRSLFTPKRGKR